jgi:hypothetical protein
MRVVLALLALLAGAATALAQGGAKTPVGSAALAAVLSLPAAIGPWQRQGEPFDYEQRPNGAGLGASVAYRRGDGGPGLVTVYVYDGFAPARRLAEGAASPEVEAQLAQTAREIAQLATERRYRVTGFAEALPAPGPDGVPALRCQRHDLQFENGSTAESHACVGVVLGRFVKLRVTQPPVAGTQDRSVAAMGAFVAARLAGR